MLFASNIERMERMFCTIREQHANMQMKFFLAGDVSTNKKATGKSCRSLHLAKTEPMV